MIIYKKINNKWEDWFAWYPVTTEDREVVIFEKVQRKIFYCNLDNVVPGQWKIYRRIIK